MREGVSVEYVIMNPASYLYFSAERKQFVVPVSLVLLLLIRCFLVNLG